MKIFKKSKWIWLNNGESADQYVEFADVIFGKGENVIFRLSCDSDYTLFINDKYVASNQYGDFEHYKIYDEISIDKYLLEKENKIKILVHYYGIPSQRYRVARAGLIYEAVCNEELLCYSSEKTLSRVSSAYASGRKINVSSQLGLTFLYDATRENQGEYATSALVCKSTTLFKRPIEKLKVLPRHKIKSQTKYSDTHYLIDLGKEAVGLADIDIVSSDEQKITVAYGEHIADGGVRRTIGDRNFYFEYIAKRGENRFTNYMLRLGLRYIEIFAEKPLEINYVGILPQTFEVEELSVEMENSLDKKIYDACVNTLRLCMMEHYVDTPWREQALYAFDSRNQMLCGYYAFKGKNSEYARANLKLIGEDRRSDGLLSICCPCGTDLAIPSFSLYYIFAMREYIEYTGDTSLSRELFSKMKGILDEFLSSSRNGLITKFSGEQMWNFYDWSSFSDGSLCQSEEARADLVINCLFVMALDHFEAICNRIEMDFPYKGVSDKIRLNTRSEFLCENGLFTMHKGEEQFTALASSLAILSGVADNAQQRLICQAITKNELAECSLSMKIFEYEALMKVDMEGYKSFIIDELSLNYKKMLDAGSDTVWETLIGQSDFENAGSLCHGWSAIPVYIYNRLSMIKNSH